MSAPKKLKIVTEIVALDTVVNYFVRGYSKKPPAIERHEYYVDTAKGQVILRLYMVAND